MVVQQTVVDKTSFDKMMEPVRIATQRAYIAAHLDWDQKTYCPTGAQGGMAELRALAEREAHEAFVAEGVGELLTRLSEASDDLSHEQRLLIRRLLACWHRRSRIPAELVARKARVTSEAHAAWVQARDESDFSVFKPHLKKVLEIVREEAVAHGGDPSNPMSLYTALLGDYEPGMDAERLLAIVREVRVWLVPFLEKLRESPVFTRSDGILHGHFNVERQCLLSLAMLSAIGYDFSRGNLSETAHPFTSTVGPDDCRVTTRFRSDQLGAALFGTIHEGGHALFDQGRTNLLDWASPLGFPVSLGLHESQSRFWENIVGRSLLFWEKCYPIVQALFPDQFASVSAEDFYRAVNVVRPSSIRIYADELTYNLHIALRVGLELELLSGSLAVADLPAAWNAKMAEYVGYTPANDAEGCLQDVHWSSGYFGYFGTYLLGNLASAQLFDHYLRCVARGCVLDPRTLLDWLRSRVHPLGQLMTLDEALQHATGEALNPAHWFEYAGGKFGALYKV